VGAVATCAWRAPLVFSTVEVGRPLESSLATLVASGATTSPDGHVLNERRVVAQVVRDDTQSDSQGGLVLFALGERLLQLGASVALLGQKRVFDTAQVGVGHGASRSAAHLRACSA